MDPCACGEPAEITACCRDTGDDCTPCHLARCVACQDGLADEAAANALNDGRWT